MTEWKSWTTQALTGSCFLITGVTITFYGKLRKLRYYERITSHWIRNITGVLNEKCHEDRRYAETYWKWFRRNWWSKHSLLLQDRGAVWCLGNSTCQHGTQKDKRYKTLFCLWFRRIILFISNFLNFCYFLSVMGDELKKVLQRYWTIDRTLFGTFWAVSIEGKPTETVISCTSNPFTLHEFSVPGRLEWYAVWARWILPIYYEL